MFKILALIACLAIVASAQYHGVPEHKDYHDHPKYKFEYGVKDPHTGDHKTQWEVRDGDVVKGQYTLHEADGTERVVDYKSDGHNGFEADVKKVGHAHHPSHPVHAPILALIACLAIVASAQYHGYGVKDPHTGDHKTQWEVRDGDVVKGQYTLHEADGTERVVDYKSDGHNGFEADVKKVGHAHHPSHPVHAPVHAPVHHAPAHAPVHVPDHHVHHGYSGASYVNVDKHY
ncbi:cuticle protein 19 [Anopheles gambiae]|uniref:cuticle protein 19 n=1 Tax=Anopheles gambiae TaxID=7165 RepID=UPI002AC9C4E2|nr:cuticle protein 19 [Anopheles gambiae]